MTSTAEHSGSNVLTLPAEPNGSAPAIGRHGMGYRASWPEHSILMELSRLQLARGDLSGLLRVAVTGRNLYRGRFNVSSLSARTSLTRDLKESTGGYGGWRALLERFCWHVLELEEEGPEQTTIGTSPRRERTPCLVDPIMPLDAPMILFGEGESFKSTLAAMIAFSVQTGIPIFPGWIPRRTNVMVLDWESGRDVWNDRIVGIANGMNATPPAIEYRSCAHRLRDLIESLARQIADKQIGLLIVDSVTPAQGSSSEGAAVEEATNRLFDALRLLGTTSLLVDHVAKNGIDNPRARRFPIGSIVKTNRARAMFDLRREQTPEYSEATQVAMIDSKVNDRARLPTFGFRVIHGATSILLEKCELTAPDLEAHGATLRERMIRALRRGPLSTDELADQLDTSTGNIRKTASRGGMFVRLEDRRLALSARDSET